MTEEKPPWLNVILFEPEIPPNTGNVMRLCANTGAALHLVHPLGFKLDEKRLRRAGMDYREWARVHEHASLDGGAPGLPRTAVRTDHARQRAAALGAVSCRRLCAVRARDPRSANAGAGRSARPSSGCGFQCGLTTAA